jgi:hypothetical protein
MRLNPYKIKSLLNCLLFTGLGLLFTALALATLALEPSEIWPWGCVHGVFAFLSLRSAFRRLGELGDGQS